MKKIKKHLKVIILLLAISIIIAGLALKLYLNQRKKIIPNKPKEEIILKEDKSEPEPEKIIEKVSIDIKGAINHPGVYEIEENKKVIDVITLAGGLTDNADTSMINLAKKVKNEMVVIIYTKEEVKEATKPNQIIKYIDKECICPQIKNDACLNQSKDTSTEKNTSTKSEDQQATKTEEKVNVNTATLEELQTITGIGESKAQAIIAYREEKGEFKTIDEIKNVTGIGDSLYEKIKDSITI